MIMVDRLEDKQREELEIDTRRVLFEKSDEAGIAPQSAIYSFATDTDDEKCIEKVKLSLRASVREDNDDSLWPKKNLKHVFELLGIDEH